MTRATRIADSIGFRLPATVGRLDPEVFDRLFALAYQGATLLDLQAAAGDARIPDGRIPGGSRVAEIACSDLKVFAHETRARMSQLARAETAARRHRAQLAEILGL